MTNSNDTARLITANLITLAAHGSRDGMMEALEKCNLPTLRAIGAELGLSRISRTQSVTLKGMLCDCVLMGRVWRNDDAKNRASEANGGHISEAGALSAIITRDRRYVEERGYPRGIDYEALILAEDDEYWDGPV